MEQRWRHGSVAKPPNPSCTLRACTWLSCRSKRMAVALSAGRVLRRIPSVTALLQPRSVVEEPGRDLLAW